METPICDFVRSYACAEPLRFHMPGHKGAGETERLDITEIEGADVLYRAGGIIQKSRENAARLFGSAATFYSVEGSSLCIRAMLFLFSLYAREQGKRPRLAAFRNAHSTFVTACALLDMDVCWLRADDGESLLSCQISPASLERQLATMEEPPLALYVTSPDYLGQMAPLREIGQICHRHGILLLVDNAHGAYLRFLPQSLHPLDLGADLCCDSAHKTLPVLTGGAYLHISKRAPELFLHQAEQALRLFASTSPSYLVLGSLDGVNALLEEEFPRRLATFLPVVCRSADRLREAGFCLVGQEGLKLTLKTKPYGYTGHALATLLAERGIVCEFSDPDHLVFMLSPMEGEEPLTQLVSALLSVVRRPALAEQAPPLPIPSRACTLREALFAPSEEIDGARSMGRILSDPCVTCPPAVPVLVCGERIDERAVACFQYYGIDRLRVLRER